MSKSNFKRLVRARVRETGENPRKAAGNVRRQMTVYSSETVRVLRPFRVKTPDSGVVVNGRIKGRDFVLSFPGTLARVPTIKTGIDKHGHYALVAGQEYPTVGEYRLQISPEPEYERESFGTEIYFYVPESRRTAIIKELADAGNIVGAYHLVMSNVHTVAVYACAYGHVEFAGPGNGLGED